MTFRTACLACLVATLFLVASPPAAAGPCDSPEARAFDFWVGDWDVVNRRISQEGGEWADVGIATDKVYSVLDGCAIIEHWRGHLGPLKILGFSVRSFDPARGVWDLVLHWPIQKDQPDFGTLEGTFRHGRGEFFSDVTRPDGTELRQRYTFSDVSPDAFRWDAAYSDDDERTWFTNWIMEFSRRGEDDEPLINGPWLADGRERQCANPESAELDHLAGRWRGNARYRLGDETLEHEAVAMVTPILEGCAQMDRIEIGGFELFAVRSWSVSTGKWVQYSAHSHDPVLRRTEGTVDEGGGVTLSPAEGNPVFERFTWQPGEEGRVRMIGERSEDEGASWQTVVELDLAPADW